MSLFNFGKKGEFNKEYSFEDIPVFSSLSNSEQKVLEKKLRLVEFKRGDIVFREGEEANAFYVVISGRFRVFSHSKSDEGGETLFLLYRGDHFGETSLLTDKQHSASVEARSDGAVLKLSKEDFLKIVQEIPSVSLYLNRSLGHRLTKSADPNLPTRGVKVASLYSQTAPLESWLFWVDFAKKIQSETEREVVVIDFAGDAHPRFSKEFEGAEDKAFDLDANDPTHIEDSLLKHPAGYSYIHVPQKTAQDEKKVSALITYLTYRFDYLLINLVQDTTHTCFQSLKQSDCLYLYCSSETEKLIQCAHRLTDLQTTFGFSKSEIKVLVPYPATGEYGELPHEEKEKILGFKIFSTIPSREERQEHYEARVRYLARELSEKLVGLALGSGAAYGLSHIGLLRVLEEENIHIDVVSGASIGALVGAFWGAGYSSDDLEEFARSINPRNAFFKLVGFRDLSLAHRGFLKGNQLIRFLGSYLGDKSFQDLRYPLKISAANLFTSQEVVIESGRLVDAIRASSSIPGIFRPFHYRGMCLIDGGVIDPLPVRILARMGVKKIIAANVLSSPRDRMERNRISERKRYQKLKSLAQKHPIKKSLAALNYRIGRRYADNSFNVIMNTIQFMEYELAETAASEADVLLHPEVHEGHWAEFYDPDKFIRAGEVEARANLDAIKQLIEE